jgi:hypothetical protein
MKLARGWEPWKTVVGVTLITAGSLMLGVPQPTCSCNCTPHLCQSGVEIWIARSAACWSSKTAYALCHVVCYLSPSSSARLTQKLTVKECIYGITLDLMSVSSGPQTATVYCIYSALCKYYEYSWRLKVRKVAVDSEDKYWLDVCFTPLLFQPLSPPKKSVNKNCIKLNTHVTVSLFRKYAYEKKVCTWSVVASLIFLCGYCTCMYSLNSLHL